MDDEQININSSFYTEIGRNLGTATTTRTIMINNIKLFHGVYNLPGSVKSICI